jgi:hypothetical protein
MLSALAVPVVSAVEMVSAATANDEHQLQCLGDRPAKCDSNVHLCGPSPTV